MSLYPDVQKRAQAELDAVVGPSRLPEHADRDALPYLDAIVKETMRWHPATPVGVSHFSTTDDEYDGHFIPKASIVVVNIWYQYPLRCLSWPWSVPVRSFHFSPRSILHDADTYPQPDEFIPERFLKDGQLNPEVRDPATVLFGFGRR